MFSCKPCKQDASLCMADRVIDSTTSVEVSGLESPNCASRSNKVCCHGNKSSDCKRDLEIACHNDSDCKICDCMNNPNTYIPFPGSTQINQNE